MKQKLALACTLVHEPALILLDEPTTGVDPVSRREFWKLLSEFLAQGITIVMATPYLDEAERCSRVALLHEGELLALDAPDRLRAHCRALLRSDCSGPRQGGRRSCAASPASIDVQLFGDRAHVRSVRSLPPARPTRFERRSIAPASLVRRAAHCAVARGCVHRAAGRAQPARCPHEARHDCRRVDLHPRLIPPVCAQTMRQEAGASQPSPGRGDLRMTLEEAIARASKRVTGSRS